jgi:hypothetical protein
MKLTLIHTLHVNLMLSQGENQGVCLFKGSALISIFAANIITRIEAIAINDLIVTAT